METSLVNGLVISFHYLDFKFEDTVEANFLVFNYVCSYVCLLLVYCTVHGASNSINVYISTILSSVTSYLYSRYMKICINDEI